MNRKGLELFKINANYKAYDEIDSLSLPNLYAKFLQSFSLGKEGFHIEFLRQNGDFIQLTCITYKDAAEGQNYENSITYFFSLNDLLKELKSFENKTEKYHQMGMIKIGYFDIADSILLGITEENREQIWKLNGDWGTSKPYVSRLSSNIYDFAENLYETVIEMNLKIRKISLQNLYKEWGKDFWWAKG